MDREFSLGSNETVNSFDLTLPSVSARGTEPGAQRRVSFKTSVRSSHCLRSEGVNFKTFAQGPGAFLGLPQCRHAALAVTRHCRYTVLVCVLCTGVYSEQQQLCLFQVVATVTRAPRNSTTLLKKLSCSPKSPELKRVYPAAVLVWAQARAGRGHRG